MFDFPSSGLTVGQIVTGPNGIQYQWDGTKWTAATLNTGNYLPLAGGTLTGPLDITGVFPSGNVTYAFSMAVDAPANNASMIRLNGQAGANKGVMLETAGNYRWLIASQSNAESGSNVGSDFGIFSYPDTGNTATNVLNITRSNSNFIFYPGGGSNIQFNGGTLVQNCPGGTWPTITQNKTNATDGNNLIGQKQGANRWSLSLGNTNNETGSNSGSDFGIYNYADNGNYIGQVLSFSRANSAASFASSITANGNISCGNNSMFAGPVNTTGLYLNSRTGSGDQYCIYNQNGDGTHFWDSSNGDMCIMSYSRLTYYNGITCMNAPQVRMQSGNTSNGYTSMLHNDGSSTYILLTNQNDAYGTWNGLRPFAINNSNGSVSIGNNLHVSGGISCDSGGVYSNGVFSTSSFPSMGNYYPVIGYYSGGSFYNGERLSVGSGGTSVMVYYNSGGNTAIINSVNSDRRLKSNIKSAGDALSVISRIPVYELDFNAGIKSSTLEMPGSQTEHWSFSLIADEVAEHIPFAGVKGVEEDKDLWVAFNSQHMVAVLWKAVQQLTEKVAALEARA